MKTWRHSRRLAAACGPVLLFALLAPAQRAWADEGIGVCRNASSGPNCPQCSIWDLEDCSDSIKTALMVAAVLAIAAAFAIALFPEILAAAGLGGALVEAEGGAVGAGLVTEEAAALEETAALTAEEATVEAEEAAAEAAEEVTQNANTGPWASDKANELQDLFDSGAVNWAVSPLEDLNNCGFAADEVNGAISTIQNGGIPDAYASPNINTGELTQYFSLTEAQYGGQFQSTTMDGIASQLGQAGDGSQGIVYVSDGVVDANGVLNGNAHVFNAVNFDGQTYFADGQTGKIWTDPKIVAGYENYANMFVEFLQTH
jgi:hypothetical protein